MNKNRGGQLYHRAHVNRFYRKPQHMISEKIELEIFTHQSFAVSKHNKGANAIASVTELKKKHIYRERDMCTRLLIYANQLTCKQLAVAINLSMKTSIYHSKKENHYYHLSSKTISYNYPFALSNFLSSPLFPL